MRGIIGKLLFYRDDCYAYSANQNLTKNCPWISGIENGKLLHKAMVCKAMAMVPNSILTRVSVSNSKKIRTGFGAPFSVRNNSTSSSVKSLRGSKK